MALAASTVKITGFLYLVVAALTASLFPMVFVLQVLIAAAILRYTRSVAFGEASGLQGLLLNISFSPIQSQLVPTSHKMYDLKRRLWHVTRPLAHSLTYTDQVIIRDIADFVFGARSSLLVTERRVRQRNSLWSSPQPPAMTRPPQRAVPPSSKYYYNLPYILGFGLGLVILLIKLIHFLSK